MNEREVEKYVKKDNIWKKPDYQAMIDEGIPLGVVYYIKKVRDCLPASPRYPYGDNTPEKGLARQKEYIETVRQLEAVMKDVRSVEDAMKACDRDISYQGTLSIAFGARGSGNAAAHYEPLHKVINLTKMHGAGSLAHEWWHGLDDSLGVKMGAGGMLSEKSGSPPLFCKLESVMKYKLEPPE